MKGGTSDKVHTATKSNPEKTPKKIPKKTPKKIPKSPAPRHPPNKLSDTAQTCPKSIKLPTQILYSTPKRKRCQDSPPPQAPKTPRLKLEEEIPQATKSSHPPISARVKKSMKPKNPHPNHNQQEFVKIGTSVTLMRHSGPSIPQTEEITEKYEANKIRKSIKPTHPRQTSYKYTQKMQQLQWTPSQIFKKHPQENPQCPLARNPWNYKIITNQRNPSNSKKTRPTNSQAQEFPRMC